MGFDLIGGIVGGATDVANTIYGIYANERNYASQQKFNERLFAYQQAQNDLTRQREDNAVQRRVADLTAAGLHPSLAAGVGAGATTVATGGTTAPQLGVTEFKANNLLNAINMLKMKADITRSASETAALDAQKDVSLATARNIDAQTEGHELRNAEEARNAGLALKKYQLDTKKYVTDTQRLELERERTGYEGKRTESDIKFTEVRIAQISEELVKLSHDVEAGMISNATARQKLEQMRRDYEIIKSSGYRSDEKRSGHIGELIKGIEALWNRITRPDSWSDTSSGFYTGSKLALRERMR